MREREKVTNSAEQQSSIIPGRILGHGPAKTTTTVENGQAPGLKNLKFFHQEEAEATLPFDLYILRSLRKIIRAIDLYSRNLKDTFGLTVPQLICLTAIVREKRLTAIELSQMVRISPSTMVGILDRLEIKRLIKRERNQSDRRETLISPTSEGEETIRKAPSLLQDSLSEGLKHLSSRQRANIAHSLKIIVDLMEARHVRAAPLLTLEGRSYAKKKSAGGKRRK